VFGTLERFRILFDSEDLLPAPAARERDAVAAGSGEGVDQDLFAGGRRGRDVFCDFAGLDFRNDTFSRQKEKDCKDAGESDIVSR